MKVAPFRALTHCCCFFWYFDRLVVEMKVAPFRALTPVCGGWYIPSSFSCGNEGRPIQGIDTPIRVFSHAISSSGNEGRPTPGHNHKLKKIRELSPNQESPLVFFFAQNPSVQILWIPWHKIKIQVKKRREQSGEAGKERKPGNQSD